jgi:hypothetical protein
MDLKSALQLLNMTAIKVWDIVIEHLCSAEAVRFTEFLFRMFSGTKAKKK